MCITYKPYITHYMYTAVQVPQGSPGKSRTQHPTIRAL